MGWAFRQVGCSVHHQSLSSLLSSQRGDDHDDDDDIDVNVVYDNDDDDTHYASFRMPLF